MADINMGNLYDLNKDLVLKHEKIYRGKALTNKMNNVVAPYLQDQWEKDSKYLMLLCHEKRDYTVFYKNRPETTEQDFIDNLLITLHNRGAIYGIDRTEDNIALEIWLKTDDDNEMHCYYLFPYDQGIVCY